LKEFFSYTEREREIERENLIMALERDPYFIIKKEKEKEKKGTHIFAILTPVFSTSYLVGFSNLTLGLFNGSDLIKKLQKMCYNFFYDT
jgi:hypothetical protein